MRLFVTFSIVFVVAACGKPSVKTTVEGPCATWTNNPKTDEELACSLRFSEPHDTIVLRRETRYHADLSLQRGVIFTSDDDERSAILVATSIVSPEKFVAQNLTIRAQSIVWSGAVGLKNVTIETEALSIESGDVVLEDVAIETDSDVTIDARDLWARRVTAANAALKIGGGEIVESEFDQITIEQSEPIPTELYVHHNSFGSAQIDGAKTFVERNCFRATPTIGSSVIRDENRFSESCSPVGSSLCVGTVDTEELGPGFDRSRLLWGDFDGDRKTEIIRIGATAWHLYDPDDRRWSVHRTERSVPWTLGVGDFDGDGRDDVFEANGVAFRYASRGKAPWKVLRDADDGFARQHLQLADVDGDGVTDVMRPGPGELVFVSKSGTGDFEEFEFEYSPGPVLTRWVGDIDDKPGAEWIIFENNVWRAYSFVDKTSEPIAFLHLGPDPLSVTSFGRFEGSAMCTSTSQSMACHGPTGGTGGGGSSRGWRQIGQGDFDGDGELELVRQHCGDHDPCEYGETTRIMTYNVNHAGIRTAEEIAREIAWIDASVVVLQEVDRKTRRNPYDMAERIASFAGYPHWEFFKSNDYQGGEYGQLVMSRDPITSKKTIALPDHDDPTEWDEHYIAMRFETGDRSYVAAHLINERWKNGVDLSSTQKKQLDALIGIVKKSEPDHVLGDFNLAADSPLYSAFVEQTGYVDLWRKTSDGAGITFPDLGGSPRRIDFQFVKNPKSAVCARVPTLITSDHYPLIVGLSLP